MGGNVCTLAYELHAHTVALTTAWASQAFPVGVTHCTQQAVAPDTGRDIIGTAETRFALSASSSATGAEAILGARSCLLPTTSLHSNCSVPGDSASRRRNKLHWQGFGDKYHRWGNGTPEYGIGICKCLLALPRVVQLSAPLRRSTVSRTDQAI
jgi:hypothetical protein